MSQEKAPSARLLQMGDRCSLPHILEGGTLVGRSSQCQIQLSDSSVAKKHLVLSPRRGKYYFRALDGEVIVNGQSRREGVLEDGDFLRVGTEVFKFSSTSTNYLPEQKKKGSPSSQQGRSSLPQKRGAPLYSKKEDSSSPSPYLLAYFWLAIPLGAFVFSLFSWWFFSSHPLLKDPTSLAKKPSKKKTSPPANSTGSPGNNSSTEGENTSPAAGPQDYSQDSSQDSEQDSYSATGESPLVLLREGEKGIEEGLSTPLAKISKKREKKPSEKTPQKTPSKVTPPQRKDLSPLKKKLEKLVQLGQFTKGRKVLNEWRKKVPDSQKKDIAQLRRELRQEELKDRRTWPARKRKIARVLKARDEWLRKSGQIRLLKKYFDHKSWAFRAMGVAAVGKLDDPRAVSMLIEPLQDRSVYVRAMALKVLLNYSRHKIRRAPEGKKLIKTLIDQMYRVPKLVPLVREALTHILDEAHRKKSQWRKAFRDQKHLFHPQTKAPDISQFSQIELQRYHRETSQQNSSSQGYQRTVVRSSYIRSTLSDLQKRGMDFVICLDVTGSMGTALKSAQENLQMIMILLRETVKNFRIGLVTYRDRVISSTSMTRRWRRFEKSLFKEKARGGGDHPEAVDKALEVALHKMRWRSQSYKMVVIVGDAPPHKEDLPRFYKLAKVAKKSKISIHGLLLRTHIPSIVKAVKITGGETYKMGSKKAFVTNFLLLVFGPKLKKYIAPFVDLFWEILPLFRDK